MRRRRGGRAGRRCGSGRSGRSREQLGGGERAAAGQLEQRAARSVPSAARVPGRARAIARVSERQRPTSSRAIRTCTVCSRRASQRPTRSSWTARSSAPAGRRGSGRAGAGASAAVAGARRRSSTRSSRWSTSSFSSRRRSSPGRGRSQVRLPQRCPGDRERVDRVRLAARAAGAPLGRGQLRRHPHQPLTRREQLPLERRASPGGSPRPPTAARRRAPPPRRAARPRRRRASARPAAVRASSTATAVSECLCTSTPITIIGSPPPPLGATGERTGLTRGSCQAPIRSRSTVSGRRRRHNAGKSAGPTVRNGVSRRRPESQHRPDATTRRE